MRVKVGFAAVVALVLLGFAIAGAVVFAAHSSMPDKYRFTGWMAPSANASPRHVTFEGTRRYCVSPTRGT